MSEYAGQDNGTLRVTIREAAARLGVTEAAVRKRIQRGSLEKEMGEDGRVYVYLDLSQDTSQPESQVHRDPLVEELLDELRDRVRSLERANEENRRIIAGLVQRVPELEAPREEGDVREPAGQDASETQETPRRSWWREFFGFGE